MKGEKLERKRSFLREIVSYCAWWFGLSAFVFALFGSLFVFVWLFLLGVSLFVLGFIDGFVEEEK